MNSIQDRCRPKHQVLVLKCYPRTRKGAVDVKPNSSELSYLLFYATSRRSKIQKIGSFLEKKTASDVWRVRIGNVQVTLQILAALIEKSPKDLPLIAPCVLRVLNLVLESQDITMIESSIPTFEAFCDNHDASSLFADQGYVQQYESVVRAYANFASAKYVPTKIPSSKPVLMRWRNAGLEAIRSIASSEALSSLVGRQLPVIVPIILENLWNDSDGFLETLHSRVEMEERVDSEKLTRRRMSIATVRTADTAGDTNPIALSGTAFDVDKLAEEDISVLAMQCLKMIFVVPNRPQIHAATQALLAFIENKIGQGELVMQRDPRTGRNLGWAITIFEQVARWAPVQDRYMILVTTMDTMVRTLVRDENLRVHLALTAMVGSLLRSDINLIGLSVMDVLLQLIQQMKKLILLPPVSDDEADDAQGHESGGRRQTPVEQARLVEEQRADLLAQIERCMGELATHIYYADQVSDMISTILQRLKPARSGSTSSSPHAEQDDDATDLVDRTSHIEAYFSFGAAKVAALRAVKSILLVANPPSKSTSTRSLSRNRVPLHVWEGTHWLLRDPDGQVRKAYVDALNTWLDRETSRADLRVQNDAVAHRQPGKVSKEVGAGAFARRAASSASNHDKHVRASGSRFLQLLHIAVYDNALQHVECDADYVLMHVLLLKLVFTLGVNAVRYGLPMIYRLQEDILDAETPLHKVRIGSLVHGYFWTLTECFDFEASVVGRAITNEIIRRRSKQFWVEGVTIPAPPIDRISTPGVSLPEAQLPLNEIESESLLPFDDRLSLVECVAVGYQEVTVSPAASPAASPGRTFAQPMLDSSLTSGTIALTTTECDLPNQYRELMLVEWTRDQAVMALQSGSRSASLNGSKAGTTGTNRNRLAVNGGGANGHTSRGYIASVDQLKQVLSGQIQYPMPGTAGALDGDSDSIDSMVSYEYSPSELSVNPESQPPPAEAAAPYSGGLQRTPSKGRSTGPLTSNPTHEARQSMEAVQEAEVNQQTEDVPPVPPLPTIAVLASSKSSEPGAAQLSRGQDGARSPGRAVSSRGGDRPRTSRSMDRRISSRGGERNISSRGGEVQRGVSMAESTRSGVVDLDELLRGSIAATARKHDGGKQDDDAHAGGGGNEGGVPGGRRTGGGRGAHRGDGSAAAGAREPGGRGAGEGQEAEAAGGDAEAGEAEQGGGKPLSKRFWNEVHVKEVDGSLQVFLDTRVLRHPTTKEIIQIPTTKPHLATALALEWDLLTSVQDATRQHLIPLTSLVCRALDLAAEDATHATGPGSGVGPARAQITKMVMRYLDTDSVLCWAPEGDVTQQDAQGRTLRELQQASAEEVVGYLVSRVWPGISLVPVLDENSIMPRSQDEGSRAVVEGWVAGLSAWELAGLERAVLSAKSLLIAARLLVQWSEEGAGIASRGGGEGRERFGVEAAAKAAGIEVAWQTGNWGEVEDTHDVDREDIRRQLGGVVLLVAGTGKE
ncbi:unnamed protein product [Parascedosporium putredinis]|uniref:Protein EFR3 n=1 Tax=Parascedosporium putredinis TaxID=1442378 RepID=A0A9P1M7P2_9PEZI|nr:unnamed protein product [Parascedosporium putredinis]CAI7987898.1 unnamed protein product [Parascedosporium putredinis]